MSEEVKYYSIGEAGKRASLAPYVLRYWETEFAELAPKKSKSGRRQYREEDIELILLLKNLLHERKFTIEGARKFLGERNNIQPYSDDSSAAQSKFYATIEEVKRELKEIISLLG